MAKSQENGITILLGLEGHKVGELSEEEKGILVEVEAEGKKPGCPRCDSAKLYRHGRAKKRKVLGILAELLISYPSLKGFYWAKEKIRELYRQKSREEASRLLISLSLTLSQRMMGS